MTQLQYDVDVSALRRVFATSTRNEREQIIIELRQYVDSLVTPTPTVISLRAELDRIRNAHRNTEVAK